MQLRFIRCLMVLVAALPAPAALAQDSTRGISPVETQELITLDTLWLRFLRQRNARNYAIATPNGIQEDRFIRVGGIEQWMSIRGEDRNNPVLLLVHGGPGDATSLYGWAMLRSWFKHYTVVQWDQRGAGKTFGRNGPTTPDVSIHQIVNDGNELSDSLCRMFGKSKIVILGHSFGSIIGLQMAQARPDLYSAFVGTGQVGAPADSTLGTAYRLVLSVARTRGEQLAVRELTAIGSPPWRDGRAYGVEHKWTVLLEHIDTFLDATLTIKLTAPGATLGDVNAGFDGEGFSGDKLVPHLNEIDPTLFHATFRVPVFVIEGADDLTTPPSLARAFVRRISAPQKRYMVVPNAGHFAMFVRPDAFLNALDRVLSVAR